MNRLERFTKAVISGDIETAVTGTRRFLDDGWDVNQILEEGLFAAMDEVGQRYSKGSIFVPEMLQSPGSCRSVWKYLGRCFKKRISLPREK